MNNGTKFLLETSFVVLLTIFVIMQWIILIWIFFFEEPKEKLKVNLHEVKYIERDYKTEE